LDNERQQIDFLPTKSASSLNGGFGRIARVGYPAAFGVKRSIERQLRKTDDRLVVADSTHKPSYPTAAIPVLAEHMTPINNQGVKDGNHQQTRSLEQGKARRAEATA
jgi:hypothetical protein